MRLFFGSKLASRFGQKNFLNVHRLYFLNASDSYVVFTGSQCCNFLVFLI